MKKVLLDKNLPKKLKFRLQDCCEIYTVNDMAWNSLENGELIAAMQNEEFNYLLTSDKNLQYQQNIDKYSMGFIVLNVKNNNYETVVVFLEQIKAVLIEDEIVKISILN